MAVGKWAQRRARARARREIDDPWGETLPYERGSWSARGSWSTVDEERSRILTLQAQNYVLDLDIGSAHFPAREN